VVGAILDCKIMDAKALNWCVMVHKVMAGYKRPDGRIGSIGGWCCLIKYD
jgi:hypothetical protein